MYTNCHILKAQQKILDINKNFLTYNLLLPRLFNDNGDLLHIAGKTKKQTPLSYFIEKDLY